jgi:hypothetical protein
MAVALEMKESGEASDTHCSSFIEENATACHSAHGQRKAAIRDVRNGVPWGKTEG